MTCASCSTQPKSESLKRLPRGWKRSGEEIYCPKCWRDRCVLRAIIIPVVEIMDGTWEDFRGAMKEAWGATTQCSNWMMTQLYAGDIRRNGEPKMPVMERRYLYPQARERFPQLSPQSIASLEQAVQAKYRAKRYEVLWTCASSLPTFRYPTPLPIHNQSWSVELDSGGRPIVSVRIKDRRWSLRLKCGSRYRRQIAAVKLLCSGSAVAGQMDLYQQKIDGKPQVMCKMVAWLPRGARTPGLEGTLFVRSTPDSLLVALDPKGETLWTYHADHIRRWSAEHREQLQRWADDSKFENRPVPPFSARRGAAAKKYRNRMNSAIEEIAASVAGYARRNKFAKVRYDDSDTSYCAGFSWFMLGERVRTMLDEYGIELTVVASDDAESKDAGPLAAGEAE